MQINSRPTTISRKTPAIELEAVNFSYDKSAVLHNITATIYQGDYVGIIGPNGSGKTSLLKLILGLAEPASGQVKLFGQDIVRYKKKYAIGYVPQHVAATNFHFPATVEEVVLTGRTAQRGFFNSYTRDDHDAVTHALETVDMLALKDRLIAHLSGGQRQRVFIARALASTPSILILDEPTAGIDVQSQEKFYGLLEELNKKQGLTIILVSHDIDIVASEISSVLCINRELVFHGSPQDFINGEYLEQLYGRKFKLIAHRHTH